MRCLAGNTETCTQPLPFQPLNWFGLVFEKQSSIIWAVVPPIKDTWHLIPHRLKSLKLSTSTKLFSQNHHSVKMRLLQQKPTNRRKVWANFPACLPARLEHRLILTVIYVPLSILTRITSFFSSAASLWCWVTSGNLGLNLPSFYLCFYTQMNTRTQLHR